MCKTASNRQKLLAFFGEYLQSENIGEAMCRCCRHYTPYQHEYGVCLFTDPATVRDEPPCKESARFALAKNKGPVTVRMMVAYQQVKEIYENPNLVIDSAE